MQENLSGKIYLRRLLFETLGTIDHERDVLGKHYLFECEHGSHEEVLAGTIQAISWSDEGGLQLYVTSPRFFGRPLICLRCLNGEWGAFIDLPPSKEFYGGKLHLTA